MTDDYRLQLENAAERYYAPPARRRRLAARTARLAVVPIVAAGIVAAVILNGSGDGGANPGNREHEAGPRENVAAPTGAPTGAVAVPVPSGGGEPQRGPRGLLTLEVYGRSDCGPCVADLPAVGRARKQVVDAGGSFLYLATKSPGPIKVPGASGYEILDDKEGLDARRHHIKAFPTTVLLNADGRPTGRRAGPIDAKWVSHALSQALDEAAVQRRRTVAVFAALRSRSNLVHAPARVRVIAGDPTPETRTHLVYEGPRYRMWVTEAPAGQCIVTLSRSGGGGGGCAPWNAGMRVSGFNHTAGAQIDAFLPDGTNTIRAHFRQGRVVALRMQENVVLHKFARLPRRVTWRDAAGRTHTTRMSTP